MKIKNNDKSTRILTNAVILRRDRGINSSTNVIWKKFFQTTTFFFDKDWKLIFNRKSEVIKGDSLSPYQLAMKYIKDVKLITAQEVNDVLAFLDISITQKDLDAILSSDRLVFTDLSLSTLKSPEFLSSIGTIRKMFCWSLYMNSFTFR